MAMFFEMEKAYDMVWHHPIRLKMEKHGLRTIYQPKFRTFSTTAPSQFELTVRSRTNEVLEGSCINAILLLLIINEIGKEVTFSLTYSFFADDFSISMKSSNLNRKHRLLQDTLTHSNLVKRKLIRFLLSQNNDIFSKRKRISPCFAPLTLYDDLIPLFAPIILLGVFL